MQKATLKNWKEVSEVDYTYLTGFAYNHPDPSIPDGGYVRTSPIEKIAEDRKSATTRNTNYTLEDEATEGSRMNAEVQA
jgi:hypothetical protein